MIFATRVQDVSTVGAEAEQLVAAIAEGVVARGSARDFVLDTVGELELSAIISEYDKELRGYPPDWLDCGP